jgi:opacity protein-like surface antigen
MKKLALLMVVVMVFVLSVSALAIDQKGKVALGAYGGYGFGFGDVFKKVEIGPYSIQNKMTFCFGAKVKYGLTPNIAIAGALDYHGGKSEAKGDFAGFDVSGSESWHWMAILANGIYHFSPEAKTCPYITAGLGYYIPSVESGDSKPGVNAGVGLEHFFKPNLALDASARFHMIFTENNNTNYAMILVGLTYYLGVK